MDGEACPRCGGPVHWSGRGRRARWCSQACRRAAYEERRAAATGAIAIRVVCGEGGEAVEDFSARPGGGQHSGHALGGSGFTGGFPFDGQLDTGAHTATLTALGRLVHILTGDEGW